MVNSCNREREGERKWRMEGEWKEGRKKRGKEKGGKEEEDLKLTLHLKKLEKRKN